MKKSFYIALASALLTGGLIKAAPALAQTQTQVAGDAVISLVSTADLDIRTAAGQRQLDQRLSIAVREVCGTASDADLAGKNDVRACRAETLAQAKAQKATILAAADRGATIAITASR